MVVNLNDSPDSESALAVPGPVSRAEAILCEPVTSDRQTTHEVICETVGVQKRQPTTTTTTTNFNDNNNMSEQKYDLIIFGATGFTGKLAVRYVADTYGEKIKWAIAGRSRSKLTDVQATGGKGIPDILIADSGDEASIVAMVKQARVMACTAGPFARYGTPVVKACAENGTDYVDITGEVAWVRDMIAQYDEVAQKSGARIVNLCGHDSIPWDLSTYMLAKNLSENHNTKLARVDFYDDIVGEPSGGTLETAFDIMFGKKPTKSPQQRALGYDPLLRLSNGQASTSGTNLKNVSTVSFSQDVSKPNRIMFMMSSVNGNAVKRSNALNGYGEKVVYCEGASRDSWFGAMSSLFYYLLCGLVILIPPLRYLAREYYLPKPGEGPSEEAMDAGHLYVTGIATGEDGSVVESTMKFNVDAGYKDTARMLIESALSLSIDDEAPKTAGGVLTPGSCQKEVLLKRLVATGTTFNFQKPA